MDDLLGFVSPSGCRLARPLIVKAETGSTNDDARALAGADAPHGTVVLADAQTAGRGRMGRAWSSPAGENLYFSIIWRDGLDGIDPPQLALVAGLAVSEAVDPFLPTPSTVKWPNDVRHGGRKLAGILAEATYRGAHASAVVLGIGVNVRGRAVPEPLAHIATTISLVRGADVDRAAVLAALLVHLDTTLRAFCSFGFGSVRERLIERCDSIGARVAIGDITGVAIDIDGTGALVVRDDHGVAHDVRAGEIR